MLKSAKKIFCYWIITLIKSPERILTVIRINMILKVSIRLLFLSKTNKPKPAFESNPLIAAPKDIEPFINIIVIPIEIAQLGIKPIIDANIGWIKIFPFIILINSILVKM